MTAPLDTLTVHCKATADQVRLQILRVLSRESFGVLELCHILAVTQPALSHHLKVLSNAGLVETRRQGTSIFYRRAMICTDDSLKGLKDNLFTYLDESPLDPLIDKRKAEIYVDRSNHAKAFFEKNAHRLKENQDLIADYHQYAGCLEGLLDNEQISSRLVVEVGPGESDLLTYLIKRFDEIIAVDNTAEMLERTRNRIGRHSGLTYFEGELSDLEPTINADLIVLNMVLHHLASPAQLFRDAYGHLSFGGQLLIAELCPHDQDWTKEICGDLWMGFDPEELDAWAISAGLIPGQSTYTGLKNGFQVQVRMFSKSTD